MKSYLMFLLMLLLLLLLLLGKFLKNNVISEWVAFIYS